MKSVAGTRIGREVLAGIICIQMNFTSCRDFGSRQVQETTSKMTNTDLIKRIARVDEVHASTMAENPTEFKAESLPFYKNFKLLRVTVDLPHRPLQFRYADNGSRLILLDDKPENIYEINKMEDLHLKEPNVVPYLRFFFENSGGDHFRIIEGENEINWLDDSGHKQQSKGLREQVNSLIHPAKIAALPSDQGYFVNITGLRGQNLTEISTKVRHDGHVESLGERVLAPNVPVPQVAW
jgi:hypothetical protein